MNWSIRKDTVIKNSWNYAAKISERLISEEIDLHVKYPESIFILSKEIYNVISKYILPSEAGLCEDYIGKYIHCDKDLPWINSMLNNLDEAEKDEFFSNLSFHSTEGIEKLIEDLYSDREEADAVLEIFRLIGTHSVLTELNSKLEEKKEAAT